MSAVPAMLSPFSVFVLFSCIASNVRASSIQFFISGTGCSGNGVFNGCNDTDSGGMCAYAADAGKTWCCEAAHSYCYDFGETCTGSSSGNVAGSDQILCQNSGATWCCNKEWETCVLGDKINLCYANFANPQVNVSINDANAIESSYLATAAALVSPTGLSLSTVDTSTPSQTNSARTTSGASISTSSGSSTQSTGANGSTSGQTGGSSSGKSLAGGAIAGIVVGAIAIVGLVAVGAFFLGRRWMAKKVDETGAVTIQSDVKGSDPSGVVEAPKEQMYHGAEAGGYPVYEVGDDRGNYFPQASYTTSQP